MSASSDLQEAIAQLLETPGALPVEAPVVRRREKEIRSDIEATDAVHRGMTIFVMPPLPTSALQGVSFLFFDAYEVRVRVIELPDFNDGKDAYEVGEAVAEAIHWQPTNAINAEVQAVMTALSLDQAAALAIVRGNPAFAPFFQLGAMLAHPISIARRPQEMVEGELALPGFEDNKKMIRVMDVIFNAVLQVNQP